MSQSKLEKIQRAIRSKHYSYPRIAEKYDVSIEEVRRIAKPLQQEWNQRRKARKELDRITNEAKYNRRDYEIPKSRVHNFCVRIVGIFLLICLPVVIGSVAVGIARWALGV